MCRYSAGQGLRKAPNLEETKFNSTNDLISSLHQQLIALHSSSSSSESDEVEEDLEEQLKAAGAVDDDEDVDRNGHT
jgi:hypothetical protein